MRKIGSGWYNGRGERIHNPCAYAKAVLENRYGFNDDPCGVTPAQAFEECGWDPSDYCPYEGSEDQGGSCDWDSGGDW